MRIQAPLNALRAFEATARHLSVRSAAEELSVTPSAVSHQLRMLEDMLGVLLFRRTGTRLELTLAGRRLAPGLHQGFASISASIQQLHADRNSPLRLTVPAEFATHWLARRLGSFPFDRYGLEISTSHTLPDLDAGAADVAIAHGNGDWPGLIARQLFRTTIDLYARTGLIRGNVSDRIGTLQQIPLFVSVHCPWQRWFELGPCGSIRPAAIVSVDSSDLALQAAVEGAGASIAVCELTARVVREGRVEPVFGRPLETGLGFWLVCPRRLRGDRRVLHLREWLLGQTDVPDGRSRQRGHGVREAVT